jgi:outer membrane protein assembly factor BamB
MTQSMSFKTLLIAGVALSLAGCSTISSINPFHKTPKPGSTASQGERIPVVFGDDTVAVSEALKGADFALPPPAPVAAWPQPGGTPDAPVDHAAAASSFQVAWRRGVGKGSSRHEHVTAPPVAAAGKIFTMDGQAVVVASDAKTGRKLCEADLRGRDRRDRNAFGGGLAFADGKLFVTSGYRFVAALDANSGAVLWKTAVDTPIHGAPSVAAGKVVAIDLEDQLDAFDVATGAPAWNYQGIVEPARILAASSPAVTENTIVAAFASGEVTALQASNGNELWTQSLSRSNRNNALSEIRDIAGRPVIYKGDVYAASHSGVFAAIDARTGGGKWVIPVSSITTPWPAGDVVYVISKAGEIICAARETGQIYWIVDLNKNFKGGKKGKGFLFFKRGGKLKPYWFGPVLASNRLVAVSSGGQAVALNPKTGAVQSTIDLGGPALMSPIAMDGMLYVMNDRAELVAIR